MWCEYKHWAVRVQEAIQTQSQHAEYQRLVQSMWHEDCFQDCFWWAAREGGIPNYTSKLLPCHFRRQTAGNLFAVSSPDLKYNALYYLKNSDRWDQLLLLADFFPIWQEMIMYAPLTTLLLVVAHEGRWSFA